MIDTTKYTQLLILKRHWGLAATVALTVVAVVIPVAMGLPNVYRAGAKLTVERQASSTAAQTAIAGGLETRLQIIRQDALSRGRIISLIDDLDLYPELRRKASLDVVIDRVQKDISVVPQTVSVGNGSQVTMSFTVGYVGNKPEMVAAVTNRLASFWVEQNSTLRTQEVSQTLLGLKAQMEEAQSRLTDANGKMQAYMLRNAAQLPEAVIAKMQQLGRVNENLLQKSGYVTQLDFQRGNLQASIADETQRSVSVGSTPEQIERAQLQTEADKYERAGQRPDGPDLKPILARIKELDQAIAAAGGGRPDGTTGSTRLSVLNAQLTDTEQKLADAKVEVTKLEGEARSLQTQINNAPVRDPQYEALKGDTGVAQDLYLSVKKQYDRALIEDSSERAQEGEEFKILEPARVPAMPAGPNRLSLMIGGVFLALVLGVGVAVLRDQLDTSFHTLEELRLFTTVPVLGSIPQITTGQQKARRAAMLVAAGCGLLVILAGVSVAAYRYAQRHEGITRIVTK